MASHDLSAVLPASDEAVVALDPRARGLVDKVRLAERAAVAKFSVPVTHTCDDRSSLHALLASGTVAPPFVVKPVVSTWPARVVRDDSDLANVRDDGPYLVQPRLNGPLTAVGVVVHRGAVVAAVEQVALRTWPADAGTSSFARTRAVDTTRFPAIAALCGEYEGILQLQFIDGRLLDANPRVYGSLPLAAAAGADLVAIHLDALEGTTPARPVLARPEVSYRWIEGDVRSLVTATRSGRVSIRRALRALLPVRGCAHSVESIRDPGPMITRVRAGLRRRQ